MASNKIHIGTSPLTNTIFAGGLLKDGRTWAANKQDVTIDVLAAVIQHCISYQNSSKGGTVVLTAGDAQYAIRVEKSKKGGA